MIKLSFLIFLTISWTFIHAQNLTSLVMDINSSFRGLDTYGKNVVWVSGSNGTVGFSNNRGKTWRWVNPVGYEKFDFRDIEALSAKKAVIMSAGSPSVILYTEDLGKTWKEVLRDERPALFLDAIAFEGKIGYAFGDPINGLFQLFKSKDKGKSWQDVSNDMVLFADDEETAFAASGSSIMMQRGILHIGTGGKYSSYFAYDPKGLRVDKYDCPISSGSTSTGIFAIDFWDKQTGIAVGGNYKEDNDNRNNICLTYDGGKNWSKPTSPVLGYRSDVSYITKKTVVATGTSGTDISYDGGKTWKNISKLSFNVLARQNTDTVYLASSNGNIYLLKIQ